VQLRRGERKQERERKKGERDIVRGRRREGEGKSGMKEKEKQATLAVISLTFSPSVITPRIYLVLHAVIH